MSIKQNKMIDVLRLERDLLIEFIKLIENLIKSEKRYKLSTQDMSSINFADKSILDLLTKSFDAEQLGLLLVVSNKLGSIQGDLQRFGQYNQSQQEKLAKELTEIVKNFNKILPDEKNHAKRNTRKK
jgi:hypothetical protein